MSTATSAPAPIAHRTSRIATDVAASLRTELGLLRLGAAIVALHVVDDNFLQPNPGTDAGDHLVSGLVPLALVVAGAALYERVRAGARASVALLLGFVGLLGSVEAVHYTRAVGPSGDDYTGLLSIPAGLALVGLGIVTLWTSRRRDGNLPWRYGRRLLLTAGAVFAAMSVLFPIALSYVVTHTLRAHVPRADLGTSYENVELTTSDGLTLKGWYVPSRNRAAVISFPGRASSQKHAKMLARHGYGVLLFDRRGEGESDGDPNLFGWQGERDVHAAVAFLQARRDVDPRRIGAVGLSVGGEMLIEAAAESPALKAIVSEGGSGRSVRDGLANRDGPWYGLPSLAVSTAATALFTNNLPPADLKSLVPEIAPRALFLVYGERGQPVERPANRGLYAAAGEPKAIWEVPGSAHMGGIDARPAEYERRIVGFFDRYLDPSEGR